VSFKKNYNNRINIINNIKAKKWINRAKWDLYGIHNWAKKNKIKPDLFISFQNTGFSYFRELEEIVYIHQALSFSDYKWNLFNTNEYMCWFKKNLYRKIIEKSITKTSQIIVQTNWMKRKIIERFTLNENNIHVIKPDFKNIDVDKVKKTKLNNNLYHIFYPASPVIYKNHKVLLEALNILKKNNPRFFKKIKLHLTIDKNNFITNSDLFRKVCSNIELHGKMNFKKVLSFYKSMDLMVFPSFIESLGLPLVEAAQFSLPIISSNKEFAKELLNKYEKKVFIDYDKPKKWACRILKVYKNPFQKEDYYIPDFSSSWQDAFILIENLLS